MKYITIIMLALILTTSCKKDETTDQAEKDEAAINTYLTDNGLSATRHSSGVYYEITKEGTGDHPGSSHTVVIDYKGYFLDGTVFDESVNAVDFKLSTLIPGFQIGVRLLKPGGEGTFYIPSQLGYGENQIGNIPPNSILIFEIELVEFY